MHRSGAQIYYAVAASRLYAEPKRLEKLGYLTSTKEPGRTRDRTVYRLTDKGVAALSAWMNEPAAFPRVTGEPIIRLLATDLVGEPATRASLLGMRAELAELRNELDEAELRAESLPQRRKYLLLNHSLARRIVDTYDEWLDEVAAELQP
jgi:DNA-binding MarR family transcriptional regulator